MNKIRSLMLLAILSLLSVVVSAQNDNGLNIVASHSILADVVSNVSLDMNTVSSLIPVGADPHGFEPSPSDLTAIAEADVVFTNGALFEEGLLESIENAGAEVNIVEASTCVPILPFGDSDHDDEHNEEAHDEDHGHDDEHNEETHDEDHDHDDEHNEEAHDEEHGDEDHDDEHIDEEIKEELPDNLCDEHVAQLTITQTDDTLARLQDLDCGDVHEEAVEEDHNHGACDPHVWMNPENVMLWTLLIRDTLIELDPDNTDMYINNTLNYITQLELLMSDEIIPMIDTLPQDDRILVTNHDSLGYFAARFDFEIVGTVIQSVSTLTEPSVQDIAGLIDTINAEGVPAIFAETTVNDGIAQTVANETGAQVVTLYTGSLSGADDSSGTYLDYMRYNVNAIVEGLGGGE